MGQNKQIKLLKELAITIKKQNRTKENIITSLQSAKILTKNKNFTNHLKNLNKLFISQQ